MEAAQADLLLQIALQPQPGPGSGPGSPPPQQQQQEGKAAQGGSGGGNDDNDDGPEARLPRVPYLREFLNQLIIKNRGALRHVPPPDLSDSTALVSAVFATLRLQFARATAAPPRRNRVP